MLFAGTLRKALLELDGDQGARGLVHSLGPAVQEVPVQSPGILVDCDTPDEYAAVRGVPVD